MGTDGCSSSENEKRASFEQGRQFGYKQGRADGWNAGVAYGVQQGEMTGKQAGKILGEQLGYERGFSEGEKEGNRRGYFEGSKAFAKNSFIPTLGLVITILLSILLFFILRYLFSGYRRKLKDRYALKSQKTALIYDIAKLHTSTHTQSKNYNHFTIDQLERTKTTLAEQKRNLIDLEIQKAQRMGHINAAQNLNHCTQKLAKAQGFINDVMLTIKVENEKEKIDLIKIVLEGVTNDALIPSDTKLKILKDIRNDGILPQIITT